MNKELIKRQLSEGNKQARSAAKMRGYKFLVPRDNERFKLLFTNSRPHIPDGKLAPVCGQTTRVLIGARLRDGQVDEFFARR